MYSDFAAGCTVITSLLHDVLLWLKVLQNEKQSAASLFIEC